MKRGSRGELNHFDVCFRLHKHFRVNVLFTVLVNSTIRESEINTLLTELEPVACEKVLTKSFIKVGCVVTPSGCLVFGLSMSGWVKSLNLINSIKLNSFKMNQSEQPASENYPGLKDDTSNVMPSIISRGSKYLVEETNQTAVLCVRAPPRL